MLRLVFVFVSTVAAATAFFSIDGEIKKVIDDCVEESKIDLTQLGNSDNWNMTFLESEESQCFVKCIAIKQETSNKDGTPNIKNIMELMGLKDDKKAELTEISENCTQAYLEEENECSKISKIQGCIIWDVVQPLIDNFFEFDEKATEYAADCQNETGFDFRKILEEPTEFFVGKDFKCFSKCIMVKYGTFNEKGEALVDNIVELSELKDNTELKELVEKCNKEVEEKDVCDRVMRIQECIVNPMIFGNFGMKP